MTQLVEDMLNFSRLGRHALNFHATELNTLVEK
jgi:hypothetical protein